MYVNIDIHILPLSDLSMPFPSRTCGDDAIPAADAATLRRQRALGSAGPGRGPSPDRLAAAVAESRTALTTPRLTIELSMIPVMTIVTMPHPILFYSERR